MTSAHKHHKISIQYPSYKCLPEKSCLHCLRILIMSWLFKDPAVIIKEIISWLFKDPIITVAWLNFDHAQSNSKKWPEDWKDQIAPNEFFSLKKQLIKFSCTYKPLLFWKNLKEFLKLIQSYQDVPFLGPNSRLRHMKNKGMQQSHALHQNSEATDMWKAACHPSCRRVVACDNFFFFYSKTYKL